MPDLPELMIFCFCDAAVIPKMGFSLTTLYTKDVTCFYICQTTCCHLSLPFKYFLKTYLFL